MDQENLPVRYHPTSKRGALLRVVRDLQRFNEEQLKILINMAHKVRRAKIQLAEVARNAEQMMDEMPGAHRSIEIGTRGEAPSGMSEPPESSAD